MTNLVTNVSSTCGPNWKRAKEGTDQMYPKPTSVYKKTYDCGRGKTGMSRAQQMAINRLYLPQSMEHSHQYYECLKSLRDIKSKYE